MSKWFGNYPTKEGYYWFYGDLWANMNRNKEIEYELEQVRVRKIANGYAYIACGSFIEPRHTVGFWCENNPPTLPEIKK